MYTQQDFSKAKNKVTLHLCVTFAIALITLGLCLACMFARFRELNWVIAAVGSLLTALYFTLYFLPWFHYNRFLKDIRSGRSHEYDVTFLSFSDQTSLRDGVAMHDMVVSLEGDVQDEENHRLFFWDDDKERPQLTAGDRIHIRAFGNYIIELSVL